MLDVTMAAVLCMCTSVVTCCMSGALSLTGACCAGREAVRMAERLVDEQSGVAFFALGVGRGVEKSELDRIIAVCGPHVAASRYTPLCTIDEAPW